MPQGINLEAPEQGRVSAFAGSAQQFKRNIGFEVTPVHICYIDDSGDQNTRVFSVLCIPVSNWKLCLEQIRNYRTMLKQREGIYVRVEFHATDFVAGRGRLAHAIIPKGARNRIFRETLG